MWSRQGPRATGSSLPGHASRVHMDHRFAAEMLSISVREHLSILGGDHPSAAVVCIGTDRSTGDALGPLVGSQLTATCTPGLKVYGTLDDPVHAANLSEMLQGIRHLDANIPVLAIDACLGKSESVGCISVKPGPLRPGTGVNKTLPPVGDLHIVGIVNVGGFMEYFVLQNTRLSLVMRMARTIATAVLMAVSVSSPAANVPAAAAVSDEETAAPPTNPYADLDNSG